MIFQSHNLDVFVVQPCPLIVRQAPFSFRQPSCSIKFFLFSERWGGIIVVVKQDVLLLKWIFDGVARAAVLHGRVDHVT
jgi:hypothetical protein